MCHSWPQWITISRPRNRPPRCHRIECTDRGTIPTDLPTRVDPGRNTSRPLKTVSENRSINMMKCSIETRESYTGLSHEVLSVRLDVPKNTGPQSLRSGSKDGVRQLVHSGFLPGLSSSPLNLKGTVTLLIVSWVSVEIWECVIIRLPCNDTGTVFKDLITKYQ